MAGEEIHLGLLIYQALSQVINTAIMDRCGQKR